MRINSIKASLTLFVAGVLVLLVVVSTLAVVGLVSVEHHLEAINQKWVSETQALGDLRSALSEFRVAEQYRAQSTDEPTAWQAEFLARQQATTIDALVERMGQRARDERMIDDLASFGTKWRTYLEEHRRWVASGSATRAVGYGTALQRRFEVTLIAARNLIDDARVAADAETLVSSRSARASTMLVAVLSILAGAVTIALAIRIHRHVTKPLGAITDALSRLAAGERDVHVPDAYVHREIGAMARAFGVFRANAEALAGAQQRAEALARHDALTGLPNRRLFASELDAAVKKSTASGSSFAVMLIDLDRFKPVNDLYGHAAGDLVLCEIASRLRLLVGSNGTVARLGGDEFAVLTPNAFESRIATDLAIHLASRIVTVAGEPIDHDETPIAVGASIGISLCPADGATSEDILRAADLAMYRAKHDGRGTFRFFEGSMDEEIRAKAELEADLRIALQNGDILAHYQPLIDLGTGRIASFEALARWIHPVRGTVPPDTFIPLADQLGLLGSLTASLLRQACRDAKTWAPEIRLGINISPTQFQDTGFPVRLAAILLEENFPPNRLEIEVTETALVGDLPAAKFTLAALQRLGATVALDDFGTGYSSLSHLREMKFDKIKIDRSFIRSMNDNPESQLIVDAVLGLARNLGMPAVAEGIEDLKIRSRLAARGCEYGQGFLFSKAVPADIALAMLREPSTSRKAG